MTDFRQPASRSQWVSRRMTAVEQLRAEKKAWRFAQLVIGLMGYGASLTLLVDSALGASSWNTLAEGIAERTGLSFGWATNLIAVAVMVFWIPLRELPGLGTVLNVVLVGLSADLTARIVAPPGSIVEQLTYFAVGLLMFAFFDAMYLGARFGSGPRDGLMTGAVRMSGKPVWLIRTAIDVVVVAIGWTLGGTLGLGTVAIALLAGPMVQFFLTFTTVRLRLDQALPEQLIVGEPGPDPRAGPD